MPGEPCLFCQVIAGQARAKVLHEDDLVLAIDIPDDFPQKRAPVHFVVIPREHVHSVRKLSGRHGGMIARMVEVAAAVASRYGIAESGYRLAANTGPQANQTVFHVHLHCIGGKQLGPEG